MSDIWTDRKTPTRQQVDEELGITSNPNITITAMEVRHTAQWSDDHDVATADDETTKDAARVDVWSVRCVAADADHHAEQEREYTVIQVMETLYTADDKGKRNLAGRWRRWAGRTKLEVGQIAAIVPLLLNGTVPAETTPR